jgi:hypothetical protein
VKCARLSLCFAFILPSLCVGLRACRCVLQPRGDPDEDYKLAPGLDMTFLLTEDKSVDPASTTHQVSHVPAHPFIYPPPPTLSLPPPALPLHPPPIPPRRPPHTHSISLFRLRAAVLISPHRPLWLQQLPHLLFLLSACWFAQYEAFERYYQSRIGAGEGAWSAFTGQGEPVSADRILFEGEAAIPFPDMGTLLACQGWERGLPPSFLPSDFGRRRLPVV